MELLKDPLNDRAVASVPPPPCRPMPLEVMLLPYSKVPSWRLIRDHLKNEGTLAKASLMYLISRAKEYFLLENNILEIHDPITIVGDIHGQFYDLLKLLEIGGNPDTTKYLFLGDYVDRGIYSIEVVILLYALKINYPSSVILLRGNHESRQMTTFFNFRAETLYKYDEETFSAIMDSFDALPLACTVNNKFLAVHGGISPDLVTLSDLERLNRFEEPPREGLFCDLLWSDPVESQNGSLNEKFKYNSTRSCSYFFGVQAATKFLKTNGLSSIIRAHEAQLEGYKMHRWNGVTKFPVVITIFSAPNYCDSYNNKGAILKLSDNTLNIQQYTFTPHPYNLPNFLNIFSWSIPFVIEKTLEMVNYLLKPCKSNLKQGDLVEKLQEDMKENRRAILINKIKSVSRMMKMFKTLRKEQETIVDLKGLSVDHKLPKGLLIEGKEALETALEIFSKVKDVDMMNEMRPPN